MKENTETLLEASRVVCLEINPEKMYIIISHHQNSGQWNIRIANELFANVAKFK
jgi:hypothetical protein